MHHGHNDREEYDCYLGESLECLFGTSLPHHDRKLTSAIAMVYEGHGDQELRLF